MMEGGAGCTGLAKKDGKIEKNPICRKGKDEGVQVREASCNLLWRSDAPREPGERTATEENASSLSQKKGNNYARSGRGVPLSAMGTRGRKKKHAFHEAGEGRERRLVLLA